MGDVALFFDRWEFRCRCGKCRYSTHPVIDTDLLNLLMGQRLRFNAPVVIHSGMRCKAWNIVWEGSPKSYHLIGMAVDYHIKGIPLLDVFHDLMYRYESKYGRGFYNPAIRGKGWIHVDVRPTFAIWGDEYQ